MWSSEGIEFSVRSLLLISVFSFVGWILLRPRGYPDQPRGQQNEQRQGNRAPHAHTATTQLSHGDGDGIATMLDLNVRTPPHANSFFTAKISHEGIIPFRNTLASTYESRFSQSQQIDKNASSSSMQLTNRKERARSVCNIC